MIPVPGSDSKTYTKPKSRLNLWSLWASVIFSMSLCFLKIEKLYVRICKFPAPGQAQQGAGGRASSSSRLKSCRVVDLSRLKLKRDEWKWQAEAESWAVYETISAFGRRRRQPGLITANPPGRSFRKLIHITISQFFDSLVILAPRRLVEIKFVIDIEALTLS